MFKDCQAKWDEEEDTKGKLKTPPLSVLEHYKKCTVEERKIIWQKPNHQQPVTQEYPMKDQKMQKRLIWQVQMRMQNLFTLPRI